MLFLCNHSAGRSQMAMGFFNRFAVVAAAIRPIRDEIERRVRQLLDDLRIPYQS